MDSTTENSKFNLSTAGSRRTVYLGDENETSVDQPSTSNGINENSPSPPIQPSTFVMYNKISTTIAGRESPTPSTNGASLNGNDKNNKSDKKKNEKNRESAIWFGIHKCHILKKR